VLTLTWRGAPLAVLLMFAAIWVSHGATRALLRSAMATVVSVARSAQRLTRPA
jgi:hypothetical protein